MKRTKTIIIDATTSSQIRHLKPFEAQNTHIICQGYNDVDIYLPSADFFPFSTEPLIISREKPSCTVSIHTINDRFQNQFDVPMKKISLDKFFTRTIKLVKESRNQSEWYVVSDGKEAYQSRYIRADLYGTSTYHEGTTLAYFFSGDYQTSQTATNYPGLRSYLIDHGYARTHLSTARDAIVFSKPAQYKRIVSFNACYVGTGASTLRVRRRQLNDHAYEESNYDVVFNSPGGTTFHNHYSEKLAPLTVKLYSTHTAFNTSGGEAYSELTEKYDIVVEGDGIWYMNPDLPANNNADWINFIKYEMVSDPDLQEYFHGTSYAP